MFITYNYKTEGVGSQYIRIIGLIAISKVHNHKYIHKQITVGHNYENDPDWNEKWDRFFNIKKLLDKNYNVSNLQIIQKTCIDFNDIYENNLNYIYSFTIPHNIIETNINFYYDSIKDNLIQAFKENNYIPKINYFDINKMNIAIHIRAFNDYDDAHEKNNYYNTFGRFDTDEQKYYNLIRIFQNLYPSANIHIFSQKLLFDKYNKVTSMKNIHLHIDNDNFDTFYHFTIADILVIAKSCFSYLAAIYNPNKILYVKSETPPLNSWVCIDEYIAVNK